jgi:predicted nucleotidyltransferase
MATVIGKGVHVTTAGAGLGEGRTVEACIVQAVERVVRPDAIILCGSRATGEAGPTSDYDVFVLLPSFRVPTAIRRLSRAGEHLSRTLGVAVSLNPLPRYRLRRAGNTFLVWKVFEEGKVLSGGPTLAARNGGMPADATRARSSYALSGIRYLLRDLEPADLAAGRLSAGMSRGVRKSLLHAAQLHLLGSGRYASGLEGCLPLLEDALGAQIAGAAATIDRPETWFEARRLLLPLAEEPCPSSIRWILENAQYLVLSRMYGASRPLRAIFLRRPMSSRLAKATVALARAIGEDGEVDRAQVRAAIESLPEFIRPAEGTTWAQVRDLIEHEWPQAQPLVGF